jgi:hypothetical protein
MKPAISLKKYLNEKIESNDKHLRELIDLHNQYHERALEIFNKTNEDHLEKLNNTYAGTRNIIEDIIKKTVTIDKFEGLSDKVDLLEIDKSKKEGTTKISDVVKLFIAGIIGFIIEMLITKYLH